MCKTILSALTVAVAVFAFAGESQAQHRQLIGPGMGAPTTTLGILGHPCHEGIFVDTVFPGSLGQRLGLERNDTILRVNNQAVFYPRDVRQALSHCHSVRLLVRDCRTGQLVWTRSISVGGGLRPCVPTPGPAPFLSN